MVKLLYIYEVPALNYPTDTQLTRPNGIQSIMFWFIRIIQPTLSTFCRYINIKLICIQLLNLAYRSHLTGNKQFQVSLNNFQFLSCSIFSGVHKQLVIHEYQMGFNCERWFRNICCHTYKEPQFRTKNIKNRHTLKWAYNDQ